MSTSVKATTETAKYASMYARQDQSDKTSQIINRTGGRLGVRIGHRGKNRMLEEGISSKRSLRATMLGYQRIVISENIP